MSKDHPQILLKLAGEGPLRKHLEILVDELGLQTNVEFLGRLSEEDVVQVLSEADLFLSTSLSDSASIALLEAIAGNREWITLALRRVDWRQEVCQQNKEIVRQRALRKNQMEIVEQAYRELVSQQQD